MNTLKIKKRLLFFIIVLFLSGLTVLPASIELDVAHSIAGNESFMTPWLDVLRDSYLFIYHKYQHMLYGYDWLAFAHFVLAILFIGPYRDPVKNIWVIEFGMIASVLIIPFALVFGHIRGIPFWWQMVDCSFGVFGFLLLVSCYMPIREAEKENSSIESNEYSSMLNQVL